MLTPSRLFDLHIFIYGNNNPFAFVKRGIKVLVVASLISFVALNISYAIELATDEDKTFKHIFFDIAIQEIIVSLMLMLWIHFYVKRVLMFNQNYGRYAFVHLVVLIAANVLSGSMNFVIASQGFTNI